MTTYIDPVFNDAAPAFPTTGVHIVRIKHVTQAAYAAADNVKLLRVPKGASIIAGQCFVFSDDASDPGQAGSTTALSVTNGTITKTVIPATTLDAVNLRIATTAAANAALKFFKTSSDDFFLQYVVGTAAQISAANIYIEFAYTMDGGRSEVLT